MQFESSLVLFDPICNQAAQLRYSGLHCPQCDSSSQFERYLPFIEDAAGVASNCQLQGQALPPTTYNAGIDISPVVNPAPAPSPSPHAFGMCPLPVRPAAWGPGHCHLHSLLRELIAWAIVDRVDASAARAQALQAVFGR